MLKLTGILLVMSATIFLGFEVAGRYKTREKNLLHMISALRILQNEIGFSVNGIGDAFAMIASCGLGDVSRIFGEMKKKLENRNGESLYQIWETEFLNKSVGLIQSDIDVLNIFGQLLGTGDRCLELENVSKTITMLELQYNKAKSETERNGKMYKSLGVLGGMAIIVLLM